MKWADVIAPPPQKLLRQFSGLFLVFFLGLAGLRVWRGHVNRWTLALALLGLGVGLLGLLRPSAIRYVYTGWMIVAFPIGWTVSRVALALVFFLVITPAAIVFRRMRRDELHLHRGRSHGSYWRPKPGPESVREYFRQS